MSVLIKGVKMPKNCTICRFCVPEADPGDGEMCMATGRFMPPCSTERLDECPLVEVPFPHGRLIDADDAFIDADERGYEFWTCDADIDSAQEFLRAQPTIIEAEEGEPDVNTD